MLKDYSRLGSHVPDSGQFATFSLLKLKTVYIWKCCSSTFLFCIVIDNRKQGLNISGSYVRQCMHGWCMMVPESHFLNKIFWKYHIKNLKECKKKSYSHPLIPPVTKVFISLAKFN